MNYKLLFQLEVEKNYINLEKIKELEDEKRIFKILNNSKSEEIKKLKAEIELLKSQQININNYGNTEILVYC